MNFPYTFIENIWKLSYTDLPPRSRVFFMKLLVSQSRNFSPFMEPEISSFYLQNSPLVPFRSEKDKLKKNLYFFKIHLNILLPSTSRSSTLWFPFKVSAKNIICFTFLSHACYILCPFQLPWFDHPRNTWF